MTSPQIIYESDDFLVLDKPAGWVVNRAQTTVNFVTVQDWLEKRAALFLHLDRAGIVHRLDKETSGLLLVAKNPLSFAALQEQFKRRQIAKEYIVLVHGQVLPSSGIIAAAIARSPFNRQRFGVYLGGRLAKTSYEVIRSYAEYSLIRVQPQTGRTHQIRVHFKHINHPVVADSLYAGRKTARQDRQWCPRQFLHASQLSFVPPHASDRLVLKAPLPPELQLALNFLDNKKHG